ncbi:MAG: SDR family NAD(P)-dependent oxidoreductase [Sporocytophaga sp.]|uniref:SDR family NAD(P)-dependent oxidoreductase n=1 Tax=Sporocytophaga sp. TaxID=2231183 RepID=UPI001B20916C|nr:SDR family NAD(P)-dependent oxidoreductase [Sporocytophaga sp.]MBO9702415.1 SDR family NAD(P)-dependent oxidoreductase [Sporocytophaga sp.]
MEQIAVVTGANRGIGLEISARLADLGFTVVFTSRDEAKGLKAMNGLLKSGRKFVFFKLDVTNKTDGRKLYEFLEKEYGRVDVLFNNAAILPDENESAVAVDLSVVSKTFETNTIGAFMVAQSVIPLMKKNNYGRIINISSGLGALSSMGGGYPAYRISKASLNAITRMLADELSNSNILVNSVDPGWVKTDMGGPNASKTTAEAVDSILWLAQLPENGPSGKFFRNKQEAPW